MLVFAPLLLTLIPKRLRGLRVAVVLIGIAGSILMVCAALYYGMKYRRGKKSFFYSTAGEDGETTGLPLDEGLEEAEESWDRDSGAV